MKRLEELGISPAPWVITKRGEIYSQEGFIFGIKRVEFGVLSVFTTDADARLIAAAPKLYEALCDMVEMYRDGGSYEYEQKVLSKARAALAEAAGEEASDVE